MLSAASHGTDQLIVQRLLATRSLRDARVALVGSGFVIVLQFLLFLLVGSAIWAAGLAPTGMAPDSIFPRFIVEHMPRRSARAGHRGHPRRGHEHDQLLDQRARVVGDL